MPKVGPMEAHLRGAQRSYKYRMGYCSREQYHSRNSNPSRPSSLLRFLVHLALVRSRGSSNPECETSSRTCGLRGDAALAAQGRAVREEVHATALLASI